MAREKTVKILRGTKAELDAFSLLQAEMGFATDTKEVYIGDGTAHHLVGKAIINTYTNRPAAGVAGRVFMASDTGALYVDDGTAWKGAVASALDWQPDVDDLVADASAASPGNGLPAAAEGQRYVLQNETDDLDTGWGTITGIGNGDIVTYNGSAWVIAYDVSVQGEGAFTWSRDDNDLYQWDGTAWTVRAVNFQIGLDSTKRTAAGPDDVANNPIWKDGANLNIKVDDASIKMDLANGYRLYVDTVDCGSFV